MKGLFSFWVLNQTNTFQPHCKEDIFQLQFIFSWKFDHRGWNRMYWLHPQWFSFLFLFWFIFCFIANFKVCPCLYRTILTIKFTHQIYRYFLWLDIFTDSIYWYFLWSKIIHPLKVHWFRKQCLQKYIPCFLKLTANVSYG